MPTLVALVDAAGIDVPLVVTQPDRPAGRGRRMTAPPVKQAANDLGIPVHQPATLTDADAIKPIVDAQPDLLVVVAYGEILRRDVLNLTPGGAINVHPSLLPKYRGATPIPAAILNGDGETGLSIIKLVRRLDAGPVIARHVVGLDGAETTGTLSERLAHDAARMLPEVCVDWVAGRIEPEPQNDAQATYTREWTRDDARIDWTRPAVEIERLVRASDPWPVAWTTFDGQPLRIHSAQVIDQATASPPGAIERTSDGIVVATGDGILGLVTVQPAGKRAMDAPAWWNGLRIERGQLGG